MLLFTLGDQNHVYIIYVDLVFENVLAKISVKPVYAYNLGVNNI
jgi:hypothetical protein